MFCKCDELKKKKKTIRKALKALDKDNFVLIMHGSSFPAMDGENTGFGTVNSNAGKAVIDYAEGLFDAIQLGPAGKTKSSDSSPYTGTIFSGNPLFIDLKQLTTKEWNNILSVETFNKVVEGNPNKDVNKTAYSYITKAQNEALKEAWNNFKKEKKFQKDFEKYKSKRKRKNTYYRIYVKNYTIFYTVKDNSMEIRLILSNKQNFDNLV